MTRLHLRLALLLFLFQANLNVKLAQDVFVVYFLFVVVAFMAPERKPVSVYITQFADSRRLARENFARVACRIRSIKKSCAVTGKRTHVT